MTKIALPIVTTAAVLIATSNLVSASFDQSSEDLVFAEVGQEIVYLNNNTNKVDHMRTLAKRKARRYARPSRVRGPQTNNPIKIK